MPSLADEVKLRGLIESTRETSWRRDDGSPSEGQLLGLLAVLEFVYCWHSGGTTMTRFLRGHVGQGCGRQGTWAARATGSACAILIGLVACDRAAPMPAANPGASTPAASHAPEVRPSASADGASAQQPTTTSTTATTAAVVLASGQLGPAELAIDAGSVYWVATGRHAATTGCAIMSVAKSGSVPKRLAEGPCGGLHPVVVDDARVFWTTSVGEVKSVAKAGGDTSMVASGEAAPFGIGVEAGTLFWINLGDPLGSTGQVRSKSPNGAPKTLAGGQRAPSPMALDAGHVYWLNADGALMRVARSGGAATTLSTGHSTPLALAVDGDGIYVAWGKGGIASGMIGRVAKDGTGAPVTVAANESWPSSLALDSTHVYWTTGSEATLLRSIAKSGGAARTLYSGPPPGRGIPSGLAVDSEHVYFTSADKVLKLRK